jgi:hypothetical protein
MDKAKEIEDALNMIPEILSLDCDTLHIMPKQWNLDSVKLYFDLISKCN